MGKRIYLAILGLLLLLPLPILAVESKADDMVFVAKDQVINGNYYAAGKNIEIYGEINGDLYLAGEKIIIDSEKINGDVFIAGKNLTIKNIVNGSVRAAGESLNIDGQVRDNVLFFGQQLNLLDQAKVGGHLSFWGSQASLTGEVTGKVEGGMGLIALNGKVGQDVDVMLSGFGENQSGLQVTDSAVIGGALNYKALSEGKISEQAQIANGVNFSEVTKPVKNIDHSYFWKLIVRFFMLLVLGTVLVYLWPKFIDKAYLETKNKFWKSLLWGLAILILTPIACVILMLTLIGLPLAFVILLLWLMGLYLAQVVVAWLFGSWLKEKLFKDKKWSMMSIMAMGVVVYIIVGQIPVVGWLVILVGYLLAWGNVRHLFVK